MTGVTVNPLLAAVSQIRKGATQSFMTGLEQLDEDEQKMIMSEINLFAAGPASEKKDRKTDRART